LAQEGFWGVKVASHDSHITLLNTAGIKMKAWTRLPVCVAC
jgi:hypothetical protein